MVSSVGPYIQPVYSSSVASTGKAGGDISSNPQVSSALEKYVAASNDKNVSFSAVEGTKNYIQINYAQNSKLGIKPTPVPNNPAEIAKALNTAAKIYDQFPDARLKSEPPKEKPAPAAATASNSGTVRQARTSPGEATLVLNADTIARELGKGKEPARAAAPAAASKAQAKTAATYTETEIDGLMKALSEKTGWEITRDGLTFTATKDGFNPVTDTADSYEKSEIHQALDEPVMSLRRGIEMAENNKAEEQARIAQRAKSAAEGPQQAQAEVVGTAYLTDGVQANITLSNNVVNIGDFAAGSLSHGTTQLTGGKFNINGKRTEGNITWLIGRKSSFIGDAVGINLQSNILGIDQKTGELFSKEGLPVKTREGQAYVVSMDILNNLENIKDI